MAKAISPVTAVLAFPLLLLAAPTAADELLDRTSRPKATESRASKRTAKVPQEQSTLDWLYDYVGRSLKSAGLGGDDAPPRKAPVRPQIATAKATLAKPDTAPAVVHLVPANPVNPGLDAAPAAPKVVAPLRPTPAPAPAQPEKLANPIVTGALAAPSPPAVTARPALTTPQTNQALIASAEKAQAALDLIKLEFASRTYSELGESGTSVFRSRVDWRVLERAADALTQDELAAAKAVGFEANAYINEVTRTIVVAVAGSEDLRRDFVANDLWQALIKSQLPQQAFMAKTYVRSVMQRYQRQGFVTECVGHSLGGAACAYAASELGIRAITVNPIAGGKLDANARFLITNYVVDGEIANIVYSRRGNEFTGDVVLIGADQIDRSRARINEKYGPIAGAILVVRELKEAIKNHRIGAALDKLAEHAGVARPF